jgi:hypothetical protein
MSHGIHKDDPKRWFYAQDESTGESSLIVFGNGGEQFISEIITGQHIFVTYLTEKELETGVNLIANIADYYKTSIENSNGKFQGPSGLYEPFPIPEIETEE